MNQPYRQQTKYRKYSAYQFQRTTLGSSAQDFDAHRQVRNTRKGSADGTLLTINYKTQVCKYWEMNQICPYGDTCIFAHGGVQKRIKDGISQKYKTKLCKNFHQNMCCPYGQRCQFIHNRPYQSKLKPSLIRNWFIEDQFIFRSPQKKTSTKEDIFPSSSRRTAQKIYEVNYFNLQNPQPSIDQNKQFLNQYQDFEYFSLGYTKPRLYSL